MRALEFKSKIKNNQIIIPARIQTKLKSKQDVTIRVIVLIDDFDDEDLSYQKLTESQFLKGYADSDAIYDAL